MTPTALSSLRQRLLALLAAEAQQVAAFVDVLQEEQRTLSRADVEPLFALAERKTTIARHLRQFADARLAVLSQAGLKDDRAGYEALLESPLPDIWTRFVAMAEQARTLNAQNGALIADRLAHNHQALAILMAHSDQPTTYGRDGSSRTRPGTRHLGSV